MNITHLKDSVKTIHEELAREILPDEDSGLSPLMNKFNMMIDDGYYMDEEMEIAYANHNKVNQFTKVEMPNCEAICGGAFAFNDVLKEVRLPNCYMIGWDSFIACPRLQTLELGVIYQDIMNGVDQDGNYYEWEIDHDSGYGWIEEQGGDDALRVQNLILPELEVDFSTKTENECFNFCDRMSMLFGKVEMPL